MAPFKIFSEKIYLSDQALIVSLFAIGLIFLTAELFLPSGGILCLAAIGSFIWAVVKTYQVYGDTAGLIALLVCVIGLPAMGVVGLRIWPRTWIGRRMAPPNPQLTIEDTSIPIERLNRCVGKVGRAISPLRPVGICEFEGERISCLAEYGMIESGAKVIGLRLAGANLAVEEQTT